MVAIAASAVAAGIPASSESGVGVVVTADARAAAGDGGGSGNWGDAVLPLVGCAIVGASDSFSFTTAMVEIAALPPSAVVCGANRAVSVMLAPAASVVGTALPAGSML